MINVIQVRSEKDLKAFVDFPYRLYKNNRYWVPPLKRDIYATLNAEKNPFWRHAEKELYLAYRNKMLAGRISVIIDYNYIDFWKEKTGYFGFFECDDDEEVAQALFTHVKEFYKEKGMTKYIGPANPSTTDNCGVLIDGFYSPPFIMTTYNFEYYQKLCDRAGLKKAKDLLGYYIEMKDAPWDYLERLGSLVRQRVHDMKVRPVNIDDFRNEVKRIKEIYNDAWSRNWGFVPMTDEEIDDLAEKLKPIVKPELVTFVEINEEPVAVVLTLPNYNVILKKLNGRLGVIEMLKFLLYKDTIKEGRLFAMGVRRKYQKKGLEIFLFLESFRAGKKLGYTGGELSWILEDNATTNNAIKKMGGKYYKKWRFYEGAV